MGITRDESGAYWSVVAALTLYNGAVLAEIFRAGVLAVPKGQAEAAYAIGMRKTQVMTLVLLPQGVKIMLPAIISQCVVALKDTSLGYAIAAPGLTEVGEGIYNQFQNQVPTMFVIASLYIAVNLHAHLARHVGAAPVRRGAQAAGGLAGGRHRGRLAAAVTVRVGSDAPSRRTISVSRSGEVAMLSRTCPVSPGW